MSISGFSAEDLPEALEIERKSNPEPWTAAQFLDELRNPLSRFWAVRLIMPEKRTSRCGGEIGRPKGGRFVLEAQQDAPRWSVLAGYICTWLVADEVQILDLAVNPAFRRRGLAWILLGHALAEGIKHGACLAVLEVRRSNTAARSLYEALGFTAMGERPGYYTVQPEPAVIMHLSLAPSP